MTQDSSTQRKAVYALIEEYNVRRKAQEEYWAALSKAQYLAECKAEGRCTIYDSCDCALEDDKWTYPKTCECGGKIHIYYQYDDVEAYKIAYCADCTKFEDADSETL